MVDWAHNYGITSGVGWFLQLNANEMENEMIKDDLIDFVNTLSNEDIGEIITALAPRLAVWEVHDGVSYLNDVEDASLNGACVQINPKHRYASPEKTDKLTRDQLYVTLIRQFHDDVWHCSRTEEGLVEIQFYVKEDKIEK